MTYDKQDLLLEMRRLADERSLERLGRADEALLRYVDDEHITDAFRAVKRDSCPECSGGWTATGSTPAWVDDHALDCSRFR